MDEEHALAIIFANTKRRKRLVDLITIAEAFDSLRKIYPSQEVIAEKTDLSREMVREFLQLLTLPDDVKELIRSRQIDSIDTAYRLATIKNEDTLRNVLSKLSNVQTHDFRDVVRSMDEKNLSVDRAKEIVLSKKPRGIHFFVIDFTDKDYRKLTSISKKTNSSPADLIKKVVEDWLNTEGES